MTETIEETKRERALRILRSRPFAPASALLGQKLLDCDPDRGWARVGYVAKPEFMNGIGVVQGGFLTAMVDEAMAIACIVKGDFGIIIPTLELKVSFLNGGKAGDLVAEIALAIEMDCEASDLALTVHPHPTLSETVALAAEAYEGTITDLYVPKRK